MQCKRSISPAGTRATVLLAVLLTATPSAWGGGGFGGIVYDPTNHAENLVTALQTAQQYALDLQRYEREFRAMLNVDEFIGDSMGALGDFQSYLNEVNALSDRLRDADRFMTELHRDFSVSQADDWEGYYQTRRRQSELGQSHAEARFRHASQVMQSVDGQYARIREAERRVPGIVGTREGLQQLNAQMTMVTRQNAQMIELASEQALVESEQRTTDELAHQRRLDDQHERARRADQRRQEAYDEARDFFQSRGFRMQ